jgi:hypothetical protein
MRSALLVVVLASVGCSQAYIPLPPGPDASAVQDATTTDAPVSDAAPEAGEAGEAGGGDAGDAATDAPVDAPLDTTGSAGDATTDAADAGGE